MSPTDLLETKIRLLIRNALNSKSGLTSADTEVIREMATRLGYDLKELIALDITDPSVNPYIYMNARRKS